MSVTFLRDFCTLSIRKSECPKEFEPEDRRSPVQVNLKRRGEKCPEPEKCHIPFQGVGRTLGGSSSSTTAPEPTVTASAPSPFMGLVLDETLPSTSIHLRSADGKNMVAHFNCHHTIGDIRAFIDASKPGGTRMYQLQTVGFPAKQLTDVTQTIEQAGLANSVVYPEVFRAATQDFVSSSSRCGLVASTRGQFCFLAFV